MATATANRSPISPGRASGDELWLLEISAWVFDDPFAELNGSDLQRAMQG
jgi:hypothetical protein